MSNFRVNQRQRGALLSDSSKSPWTTNIPPLMPPASEFNEDNGGFQQSRFQIMCKETAALKNENVAIKNVLNDLQTDRNKLRNAVRKLKVENGRLKGKLKRVEEIIKGEQVDNTVDDIIGDVDFEKVKEFLLIGGPKDPFDFQYPVTVNDLSNCPHKSCERYMWYKMAECFEDIKAMEAILTAETNKIDDILNNVKNYDKLTWDATKIKFFEEYQRLKFDQHRQLKCLLIMTRPTYLAFACQDKIYGTGWRKQRSEADRPQMWDGQNLGGKVLMKLRTEFAAEHVWNSATEEEESRKLYNDHCQKNTWKRFKPKHRATSGPRAVFDDGTSQFYGEGYTNFAEQTNPYIHSQFNTNTAIFDRNL